MSEYSEWVAPNHELYQMTCCDCGLVHDMQFRVFEITGELPDDVLEVRTVTGYGVEFRVKRNDAATAENHKARGEGTAPRLEKAG